MTPGLTSPFPYPLAIWGRLAPWQRATLGCLVVAAVLALPYFLLSFIPAKGGDESYQNLCCRHFDQSPLAMLTFYFGHQWMNCVGDSYMHLRYLGVLVRELALITGCAYFYYRSKRADLSVLLLVVCIALSVTGGREEYNWDIGAYPWVILWLISLIEYIRKKHLYLIALAGVFCACAVLSHVTYLVFALLSLALITYSYRPHYLSATPAVICFSATLTVVALSLMCLMVGSPAAFFASFHPDNIINGHSPLADFHIYYYGFTYSLMEGLINALPLMCCLIAAIWYTATLRHHKSWFCGLILICAAIGLAFDIGTRGASSEIPAYGLQAPAIFGLLFLIPLYNLLSARKIAYPRLIWWLLLLTILLIGLGSNYMLERALMFTAAIPLVYACIYSLLTPRLRRLLLSFLLFSLAAAASIKVSQMRRLSNTHTMSTALFPKQDGIFVTPEDYHWRAVVDRQMRWLNDRGFSWVVMPHAARHVIPYVYGDMHIAGDLHTAYFDDATPAFRNYLHRTLGLTDAVVLLGSPKSETRDSILAHGYQLVSSHPYIELYVHADKLHNQP